MTVHVRATRRSQQTNQPTNTTVAMHSRLLVTVLLLLAGSTFTLSAQTATAGADATTPRAYNVAAAGPYVERGTACVQVLAKLGTPTRQVSPELWIYRGFGPVGTGKAGTNCRLLVVFFRDGWVSDLKLANAPGAEFLVAQHEQAREATVVASNRR